MKIQLNDSSALKELTPANLMAYLKSKQATFKGDFGTVASIWELNGKQLLVPNSSSYIDYASAVSKILNILENIETRDQLAIYKDIHNSTFDIIRVRNTHENSQDGTLGLSESVTLLTHTKEMLYSVACSVATGKPFYSRRKPQVADDFMKRLRCGQTEYGSFVVTILSPVTPELSPTQLPLPSIEVEPEESYERKVIPGVQTALESLNEAGRKAAEQETIDPFILGVKHGISANLCDAVVGLQETAGNGFIEISISYALNRRQRQVCPSITISRDYIPYFRAASKQIKDIAPKTDQVIRGPIIAAKRRNPDDPYGQVTIQDINLGHKVIVTLEDDDYTHAVTAHRDRGLIELSGTMQCKGHMYYLTNFENIKFIDNLWEESVDEN